MSTRPMATLTLAIIFVCLLYLNTAPQGHILVFTWHNDGSFWLLGVQPSAFLLVVTKINVKQLSTGQI